MSINTDAPKPSERKSDALRISADSLFYLEVPKRERPAEISQKDWDKLARINDKIALHMTYDKNRADAHVSDGPQSPRETIKRRSGICMDFAALFEITARKQGYIVRSVACDKLKHVWNEVNLGDSWWIIDTAWNIPGNIFDGNEQRNNPYLLHCYFLTTVEEELMWKSKGLLEHTHDCPDTYIVNYEKTIEYRELGEHINELINEHNELLKQYKDLGERINTNVARVKKLLETFNTTSSTVDRDDLLKRAEKGKNIIEAERAERRELDLQTTALKRQIEQLQERYAELKRRYPLGLKTLTIAKL